MTHICKICLGETTLLGEKKGHTGRMFQVCRCPACGYAFVANPWDDFEKIYNEEYYCGRGPDPLLDYVFELEHPRETIRQFEWQGIVQAISSLVPLNRQTRWLDFGCGNGGLVRYCRETAACDAVGFEEGWISHRAAEHGIPILDRASLAREQHSFDVVTAIEVIEHTIHPLEVFQTIRSLLKPGGLLFLTTGNAQPFAQRLLDWPYIVPEIHVSFFEPRTLHRALEKTGFRVGYPGFCPGYDHIIKFKVLKNFRFHRRRAWLNVVPWRTVARICDARLKITALPTGWATG